MKVRLQQMEAESLSFTPEGAHVGTVKDGSNGENVGEATAAVVALATAAARAVVKEVNAGQGAVSADEAVADADARSIYVGNVSWRRKGFETEKERWRRTF